MFAFGEYRVATHRRLMLVTPVISFRVRLLLHFVAYLKDRGNSFIARRELGPAIQGGLYKSLPDYCILHKYQL